jgi:1-phosphatidylinositol phosphodiesterase
VPPPNHSNPLLDITYFSAASFPLAFPPMIALGFGWPKWGFRVEGINSRVRKWLLNTLADEKAFQVEDISYQGSEKSEITGFSPETVNSHLLGPKIRGWALMDFYDSENSEELGGVVPLLVECNFWGRTEGEAGW